MVNGAVFVVHTFGYYCIQSHTVMTFALPELLVGLVPRLCPSREVDVRPLSPILSCKGSKVAHHVVTQEERAWNKATARHVHEQSVTETRQSKATTLEDNSLLYMYISLHSVCI